MEIGASFVSDAEPFELVQPGEGALDLPLPNTSSALVGSVCGVYGILTLAARVGALA